MMKITKKRLFYVLWTISFGVSLTGCGDKEFRHTVYPASGKVTQNGKPVSNAMITFHPVDPTIIRIPEGKSGVEIAKPTTTTDENGRFQLSTYLGNDGAPAGDYKVTVILPSQSFSQKKGMVTEGDEELPPNSNMAAIANAQVAKSKFPYSSAETTSLQASIKSDSDNTFEFDLK
ncbi:MAG: hypothetical protein RJA81_1822 [Planctomycetota bacterium]|jgi:hypothetical protein